MTGKNQLLFSIKKICFSGFEFHMVSSLRNAYNNRIQDTKPNQFILIDMCRKMSLQIIWKMLRFSSIQQWVKNENHFIFFFIT